MGNSDAANSVIRKILASGGDGFAIQARLGSVHEAEKLFSSMDRALNSRRGSDKFEILLTMRESAFRESNRGDGRGFRQTFGVNTKGTWLVTKATIPRLSVGGRIVNISSGASRRPGSLFGLCAMTKAAVEAMTFGAGSRAWPARNYSEYDCTGLDRNRRKRFGAVECRRRTQRYQPNSSWLIGFAGGHRRSRCISGFRR